MPENDQQGTGQAQGDQQAATQGGTPETWQAWLEAQPEDQRTRITTLHESHTQGLRSALDNERAQRREFEKQLRDLQPKVEKGSALETQINTITAKLDSANRRAEFVEEAVKPEIGIVDLKLAWLTVNAEPDTYLDKRGRVDFALLKQNHPALFKSAAPPRANAGNGAGQDGGTSNMNDFIRRQASR